MVTMSSRVMADGERLPLLLDGSGMPLFYPTLFETARLRNGGDAANTIRNKLGAIEVLLRWESAQKRDLIAEFTAGHVLVLKDIVSLRDFCGLDMRGVAARDSQPPRTRDMAWIETQVARSSSWPRVSCAQQYNRLTTIADYVEFVASVVTQYRDHPSDAKRIAKMVSQIRHHRPRGKVRYEDTDPNVKSPPTEVIDRFMAAMAVDSPENPFHDPAVRLRNAISFGLLRWTGMRRGELLSLCLNQLDLGEQPQVWVRRNQDDDADPRPIQPSSKTKERPLPIPDSLAEQIQDYVLNVRAKVPAARRHPYLLISHRAGPTYGRPLSASALSSRVMPTARSAAPEFARIHPHAFRHHFNYELSVKIDMHNSKARSHPEDKILKPITDAQEVDIRKFLNGQRSNASAWTYMQRHIREQADNAVRQLQADITGTKTTKASDDAAKR